MQVSLNLMISETNSSTRQYRNVGCAYLARKHLDISWIFTERDHCKDPMDDVGAATKNAFDDAVVAAESIPNTSIRSASDIAQILKLVNVQIYIYV